MKFSKTFFLFLWFSLSFEGGFSQPIVISEVVASNSIHYDEDLETPDWFELHNTTAAPISLKDWAVSDDPDHLTLFTFPEIAIAPHSYLMVWASDKNRKEVSYWSTLVDKGSVHKYLVPSVEPSSNWKSIDFQDASWALGASGFGYADEDDATQLPPGTKSIFTRIDFDIQDLEDLTRLVFDIDYDDGFIAYINGEEVARSNMSGISPPFNASSVTWVEATMYQGGKPARFEVDNPENLLVEGTNTLAIQLHNYGDSSSDMTLIPFLSALFSKPNSSGSPPPEILELVNGNLHTNFKISSRSDQLLLTNPAGELIDALQIQGLEKNISYGVSSQSGDLVYFSETTPGAANSDNEYLGILEAPVFSVEGGMVEAPFNLSLSTSGIGQIRYATGGALPTETSPVYTAPISVSDNVVVRAKVFAPGYLSSQTVSNTYLFNVNHEIDVFSLVADPADFFDLDRGIYVYGRPGTYDENVPYWGANFWEDWERPIHVSFYEKQTNNLGVSFDAGVKIYGAWSRGLNAQKSLAFFARSRYGTKEFKYPFFENRSYDEFQALVLRNSGNDWLHTTIRDAALTSLMEGSGLDIQAYKPVATYLNGGYWGMYNLREKINEHMLASKHDVDADLISILTNNSEVLEGTDADYNALINYVSSTDLSNDDNFEYVREKMDVQNYIMYQTAQIYIDNQDWPGNNIKYWSHPQGKWRWILYDTDFGFRPNNYGHNTLNFALNPNGPGWPNPPWATLLFRRLMTNIGFRNDFINRYADELNTRFLPGHVKNHIETAASKVAPEIQAHYDRWGGNYNDFTYFTNEMKVFSEQRPTYARTHIKEQFGLPGTHLLYVSNNDPERGSVEVNDNLNITTPLWSGVYFEDVPLKLTAKPKPGYEFSHWSLGISSMEQTLFVDMKNNMTIRPNFTEAAIPFNLVINEINFKSHDDMDAGDWIELYNPNSVDVDVSEWILKDDDDAHSFVLPVNSVVAARDYLVLVKESDRFSELFPDVNNLIGGFDFGFGSEDAVRLYNRDEILQDAVFYTSESPWPECANGSGATLELKNSAFDNALADSWTCGDVYGTPGTTNTLGIPTLPSKAIQIYPSLIAEKLYINEAGSGMNMAVYDVFGKRILSQKTAPEVNVSFLKSGVYIVKISQDDFVKTFKIIKQ